jgi:glycosyltransferase involved in cell wall biosynthesis
MAESFCIIYLGRKGGGLHLAATIQESLSRSSKEYFWVLSRERSTNDQYFRKILHEGRYSLKSLVLSLGIFPLLDTYRSYKKIRFHRISHVIFLMPHPLDFVLRILCKFANLQIESLIHDYDRHTGEYWPLKFYTKLCIQHSTRILVLSNFTASQIRKDFPETTIRALKHPTMRLGNPKILEECKNVNDKSVVFLAVGRIRDYKGLDSLQESWNIFQGKYSTTATLIIAGEGSFKTRNLSPGLVVVNRWLSDEELAWLVKRAQVFVFNYMDASQSGFLSFKEITSKIIIATGVGGLREQLPKNAIVIQPNNPKEMASVFHRTLVQIEESASGSNDLLNLTTFDNSNAFLTDYLLE